MAGDAICGCLAVQNEDQRGVNKTGKEPPFLRRDDWRDPDSVCGHADDGPDSLERKVGGQSSVRALRTRHLSLPAARHGAPGLRPRLYI
jgi:hypothetical protein